MSRKEPIRGADDSSKEKLSKGSRVAKLYHGLVYYPLIKHIRTDGHDEKSPVPDNLIAVGWTDG